MKTFTVTYTVEYELSISTKYVWTKHKECFNTRTGRRVRQSEKNGMIGYYIDGKFMNINKIRPLLVKPKVNDDVPF